MVYFIAHRGNTNGPNKERENKPDYIDLAISQGFDVEVDVWILDNDRVLLGHDGPETEISINFLQKRESKLWCHAKNLRAMEVLPGFGLNTFSHDKDDYVYTSKGYIWSNIDQPQTKNTICVMTKNNPPGSLGYCSDYIKDLSLPSS